MGFTAEQPITAGTILVIDAIQSPNYVAGSSGWIISQDGSAEFNSVVLRGNLRVTGNNNSQIYINNVGGVPRISLRPGDINGYPTFNAAIQYAQITANQVNGGTEPASQVNFDISGAGLTGVPTPYFTMSTQSLDATTVPLTIIEVGSRAPQDPSTTLFQVVGSQKVVIDQQVVGDSTVGGHFTVGGQADLNGAVYVGSNATEIGRGILVVAERTSNSAAVTAVTVVLSTANAFFVAGRAYEVEIDGGFQCSVTPSFADMRLVKGTTTGGLALGEFFRFPAPSSGLVYGSHGKRIFTCGSSVTTQISLTLQTPTGTVFIFAGAGTTEFTMTIRDIGPATAYPNAPVLT